MIRTLLLALALFATPIEAVSSEDFIDPRDGESYRIVTLGRQQWMGENLRYDAGVGSRCFEDVEDNCREYGRLYQWDVATRACPEGWRLATEGDWRELELFLGLPEEELDLDRYRGVDEGARLRRGGDSGFEVLLGGYMRPDGTPRRMGERAAYWSATLGEGRDDAAWHRDVSKDPRIYRSLVDTVYFLSVRCLRSAP